MRRFSLARPRSVRGTRPRLWSSTRTTPIAVPTIFEASPGRAWSMGNAALVVTRAVVVYAVRAWNEVWPLWVGVDEQHSAIHRQYTRDLVKGTLHVGYVVGRLEEEHDVERTGAKRQRLGRKPHQREPGPIMRPGSAE